MRETASNAYGSGSVESAATAVVNPAAGAIAGTVRSAGTGTPIANASVKCGNGYSAKTASEGDYSIANVAPGSYSCTASANALPAVDPNRHGHVGPDDDRQLQPRPELDAS